MEEALRPSSDADGSNTDHGMDALRIEQNDRHPDSDDEDELEHKSPVVDEASNSGDKVDSIGIAETAISLFLAVLTGESSRLYLLAEAC